MKSRIIVTEKGQALRKEIEKEFNKDKFSLKRIDTATYNSLNEPISLLRTPKKESKVEVYEGIFGHLTINETIKRDLSPYDEQDVTKMLTLETDFADNTFLKAKVGKLNRILNKSVPNSRRNEATTFLTLPNAKTVTERSSRVFDANTMSINSRGGNNTTMRNADTFRPDLYPKIMQCEMGITKLLERHVENKKRMLNTAKQVLENYEKKVHSVTDQNHKPPELLESLRADNPEAVDILLRNTQSKFRMQDRLHNYHKQKFQPYQRKYSDMSTKRFQNHLNSVRNVNEKGFEIEG